ncbi:MAG: hypothetical protein ACRDM7_21535 [Thermoleophilaceae bacterium]
MRERRCFVQFIHPGGEHWPDRGDRKFWNREAHRRKFLKGRGRYITGGEAREGEIVFWGEWEPESRVLARYSDRVADGPHFLYEPGEAVGKFGKRNRRAGEARDVGVVSHELVQLAPVPRERDHGKVVLGTAL